MKESDEDVAHAGIVSESQKIPKFKPILEFATDRRDELVVVGWYGTVAHLRLAIGVAIVAPIFQAAVR